jgi:hypothetical protein
LSTDGCRRMAACRRYLLCRSAGPRRKWAAKVFLPALPIVRANPRIRPSLAQVAYGATRLARKAPNNQKAYALRP